MSHIQHHHLFGARIQAGNRCGSYFVATNGLRVTGPDRTTYTVLNALAGHFNSFGNNAPLPKKRLDRIVKVRQYI